MSRFLLVVPPLPGHIAPLRGVADALTARGHEVAWAGVGEVFPCDTDDFHPASFHRPSLRGAAALKFLVEDYLVPLAQRMEPGVTAAIKTFEPDLVVVDQQTYAGAFAADRLGVPWVTSASTTTELTDPYPPKIEEWLLSRLTELGGFDPRFSPSLVLAYSSAELTGPVSRPVSFVGPMLPPCSPSPVDPPLVFVTLGTVNDGIGGRFLNECVSALASRDVRAVVVDPGGHLGPVPPNVVVAPHVDQLAVLASASLVICHGGHNTVCETLWHGLPLVVAPIRDDQQVVAGQVAASGAGVRLRFAHATAAQIGAAVDELLVSPSFLAAAQRIQRSFLDAGGAAAAVGLLEGLISA
ncbi:glycosyl transferase [Lentzea sp. NBRC 105346]|uniref:glycosyltransferase n=1 Tax=Lentzea sp. NBRC 105346 TaxID=3032205 RepID=UPI0024A43D2E|nr:nucleotide disphospho-sugar-binding domain-containing protein [Lentzea sp. NBRC 105346]GLZ35968.1 glycosyl transferase [Lentzea sp. NBRC 105346]